MWIYLAHVLIQRFKWPRNLFCNWTLCWWQTGLLLLCLQRLLPVTWKNTNTLYVCLACREKPARLTLNCPFVVWGSCGAGQLREGDFSGQKWLHHCLIIPAHLSEGKGGILLQTHRRASNEMGLWWYSHDSCQRSLGSLDPRKNCVLVGKASVPLSETALARTCKQAPVYGRLVFQLHAQEPSFSKGTGPWASRNYPCSLRITTREPHTLAVMKRRAELVSVPVFLFSATLNNPWGACARPGAILDDPCGSLPTQLVLWFCGTGDCFVSLYSVPVNPFHLYPLKLYWHLQILIKQEHSASLVPGREYMEWQFRVKLFLCQKPTTNNIPNARGTWAERTLWSKAAGIQTPILSLVALTHPLFI